MHSLPTESDTVLSFNVYFWVQFELIKYLFVPCPAFVICGSACLLALLFIVSISHEGTMYLSQRTYH